MTTLNTGICIVTHFSPPLPPISSQVQRSLTLTLWPKKGKQYCHKRYDELKTDLKILHMVFKKWYSEKLIKQEKRPQKHKMHISN